MEIRLRPIVAAFIVLALVGALGYFALPGLGPLAQQLGLRSSATATVPAPAAAASGGPAITYLDQSLGWDWQADCAAQFGQFLARELPGRRIDSIQVLLVDYTPDSIVWLDERDRALALVDRIAPSNGTAVWSADGWDANDLLQRGLLADRLVQACQEPA